MAEPSGGGGEEGTPSGGATQAGSHGLLGTGRVRAAGGAAAGAGGSDRRASSHAMSMAFPRAAQPEIMRAAEKDEEYLSSLCDACYDAVRHMFGMRTALTYQSEAQLAGRVLYYVLTTGAGLQTLGEEYCSITQVAGPVGLPATPARRVLLVFLHSVFPYLAERLSSRAAARGAALRTAAEPSTPSSPPSPMNTLQARNVENGSSSNLDGSELEHRQADDGSTLSEAADESVTEGRNGSSSMVEHAPTEMEALGGRGERERRNNRRRDIQERGRMQQGRGWQVVLSRVGEVENRIRALWQSMLRGWPTLLPAAKEALQLTLRMHLMLFYFEGLYYNWAKRATGIRYIFTGRADERRPQ